MNQIFHIQNEEPQPGVPLMLLFRTGEKHTAFAVTSKDGNTLYTLAYCLNDKWDDIMLEQFYYGHPVLQESFYEVRVAFDHPTAALLSAATYQYEEAGKVTAALWGISGDAVQSELVSGWQIQNVFTVPKEVRKWVTAKYPAAKTYHQYSVSIRTIDCSSPGGCLLVDIRQDDFTLVAVKDGKLLLAQVYTYETPDDVLYYLLRAANNFEISREKCELKFSGLVDQQSTLYKELYLYFMNIQFRHNNWNTDDMPAHFFSSLNDLARCE